MGQKNSKSLIKLNSADEWQVQCINVKGDNVSVKGENNKLYVECTRARTTEFVDVALDRPSAQALVDKMQELIEGME